MSIQTFREVPFFNYSAVFRENRHEITDVILGILERGSFILGQELAAFEEELAHFVGSAFAVGVANGTDALMLALRAAEIGEGDQVILPSHTYVATAAAVRYVGAEPVLVECGEDHVIDPEAVRSAITPKTKAVMPVHLNGRTCAMAEISSLAAERGLTIIEDSAQALGARLNGRGAGTFGLAAGLSFYPAKILGCFGDGGAVLTNDEDIAAKVSRMRDHGRNPDGVVVEWGLNSRLDNVQAGVLLAKLRHLPDVIARRRAIAQIYDTQLQSVEQVRLPPPPDSDGVHFDVFQNYEVEAVNRDELVRYLRLRGIGTTVQWGGTPVHRLEALGFASRLPRTDAIFTRCMLLPLYPAMSDDDVVYVSESIRAFYSSSR